MRIIITIISALLLLSGCSGDQKPDDLIAEQTYIKLMAELQLTKAYWDILPADSLAADSLRREVYEKYDITEERFKLSHRYYQQQPVEQQRRIEEAIELLRVDEVEGQEKQDSSKAEARDTLGIRTVNSNK